MNAILVSDLHLTSVPRDEYRWKLFDWLLEVMPKHNVKALFILGDLTEAKDNHSAQLVNRIVDNLLRLYRQGGLFEIYVLRGNHDGLDPTCAYFRFLGQYPSIKYHDTPWLGPIGNRQVLMLPHTRDPMTAWQGIEWQAAELVFMHQTLQGAVGENGTVLDGIPTGLLRLAHGAKIYSGDVHVPQTVGPVEYVGAPYPVRFGDNYVGRAVLLEGMRRSSNLWVPSIRRSTITVTPSVKEIPLKIKEASPGDQIKARIRLAPHEYVDWQECKAWVVRMCEEAGLELCSVELERTPDTAPVVRRGLVVPSEGMARRKSPIEILNAYCIERKVPDEFAAAGRSILSGVSGT